MPDFVWHNNVRRSKKIVNLHHIVRRWKKGARTFLGRTRTLSGVMMSSVQKKLVITPDNVRHPVRVLTRLAVAKVLLYFILRDRICYFE